MYFKCLINLWSLLSVFVHILGTEANKCQPRNCPKGSKVVECSSDGKQNTCEVCNDVKCFPPPHCPPEATIEFTNATQDPQKPPECVCDTSQNYYGKYFYDCLKKDPPCASTRKLDRETGACSCPGGFLEIDHVCVKQPESEPDSSPNSGVNTTGAIVGGCIGGFVLVLLVIGLSVVVYKRKRKQYKSIKMRYESEANPKELTNGSSSANRGPSDTAAGAADSDPGSPDSGETPQPVVHNHINNYNIITADIVQQGEINSVTYAGNGSAVPPKLNCDLCEC